MDTGVQYSLPRPGPYRARAGPPSEHLMPAPQAIASRMLPPRFPHAAESPIPSPRSHWGSIASESSRSSGSRLRLWPPFQERQLPIQVLFVTDPTRYTTLQDARGWNVNFLQRNIPDQISSDEWRWLHDNFPRMIFKSGEKKCFMHEFVSLCI